MLRGLQLKKEFAKQRPASLGLSCSELLNRLRRCELDHHHLANIRVCLSHPGTGPYVHMVQTAQGVGKSAFYPVLGGDCCIRGL